MRIGIIDLYHPNRVYGEDKKLHFVIPNVPSGKYNLMIEPVYDKNSSSSDYLIDIAEVKFVSDGTSVGQSTISNLDSVCTP